MKPLQPLPLKQPPSPTALINVFLFVFLLAVGLLTSACSSTIDVVRLTPPLAYVQLPQRPTIPTAPVSNVALVTYLYELHDDNDYCRAQINNIKQWMSDDD